MLGLAKPATIGSAIAVAAFPAIAGPQLVGPAPDLSAAQAQAAAALQQAQAALAAANSAVAAVPPLCTSPPASDTLMGAAGIGQGCTPPVDSARPTAVQAANALLAADCTWSVTFKRAFTSALPVVHAEPVLPANASQPLTCSPTSRSTQVESGRCFAGQTVNVTLAGVTAGLNLNSAGGACTAGTTIMVWGREPTQ